MPRITLCRRNLKIVYIRQQPSRLFSGGDGEVGAIFPLQPAGQLGAGFMDTPGTVPMQVGGLRRSLPPPASKGRHHPLHQTGTGWRAPHRDLQSSARRTSCFQSPCCVGLIFESGEPQSAQLDTHQVAESSFLEQEAAVSHAGK